MKTCHWASSLVTRLVVGFCLGGFTLSVGLAALEYSHARHEASTAASQQMTDIAQQMTDVLRPLLTDDHRQSVQQILDIFARDPRIAVIRLDIPGQASMSSGTWPEKVANAAKWTFDPSGVTTIGNLDLSRQTVFLAPFDVDHSRHTLHMVIDGPYLRRQVTRSMLQDVALAWLMLGVLTLVGLLLLRRWFINPLLHIVQLTSADASSEQFKQTSDDMRGEFGTLTHSIAQMLGRLDDTTERLRRRERAFEHLYQFAPTAMISIDARGRIIEANQQAAELFGMPDQRSLGGAVVMDYVHPKDRSQFRQCIDRLKLDQVTRSQMQMSIDGKTHDVDMQFAGVYGAEQALEQVRISLVDVSDQKELIRQVCEQRQLLDLVIDHMSDGIMLLRPDHRVLMANSRLCELLNVHPDTVVDQPYEPTEFWASLEVLDTATFDTRMHAAIREIDQPCQEQFDTQAGSFRFEAIPVHDTGGEVLAQLWVIQDVSHEVRNRRLLQLQDAQLQALQRMGRKLHAATDVEHLLELAVNELYDMIDVEVVGITTRHFDSSRHNRQLIHDGAKQVLLQPGQALSKAVNRTLMPAVLSHNDTNLWTDLSRNAEWADFTSAGIESMAATALVSQDQTQGIVWIGRKGGKRIERYQLYLLEAMAPMLSTALQNASLREQVRRLAMTDPITGLPGFGQYDLITRPIIHRSQPWAIIMVDIDRFDDINAKHGTHIANEALRHVADSLRDCSRSTDSAVRHTADRFVLICPDTHTADAAGLAERIRKCIEQRPLSSDGGARAISLTCSMGVASSKDSVDPNVLVELANERVKRAKAAGRNCVETGDVRPQAAG